MQSATQHNQDISRLDVKLIRTPYSELRTPWFILVHLGSLGSLGSWPLGV